MGRGFHLTIDEWFYHWFADPEKLPIASSLFEKMFSICDKIVIQKGSRLAHKFFDLVNSSSMYPPRQREEVKALVRLFITNSNKVFWVNDVEQLAEDIIPLLPRKDLYLIQICLQTEHKIIVTSDTTLYQNLIDTKDFLGVRAYLVQEFVIKYPVV
jgi:hypothetical protein